jgi:hypothetical protein
MSIPSQPNRFLDRHFRVSKSYPCPICGKPDYCAVSRNGRYVLCQRVPSDRYAGKSGYYHKLNHYPEVVFPIMPASKPLAPKANPEIIHQAYVALLSLLTLSSAHLSNLLGRGLTQEQITALSYKTLPLSNRAPIMRKLILDGVVLNGVPGFWKGGFSRSYDSSEYRLAGQAGILVPVRNLQGTIGGLQIRCDNQSRGKYQWLSSANKPNGTSSGVSVHVAGLAQVDRSEIWITEGPIKADIASLKLNRIVLAVPGVGNYPGVIPIVQKLNPQRVVVALDMDKAANPMVKQSEKALISSILHLRIRTFRADWDAQFKGLDDFLVRGL